MAVPLLGAVFGLRVALDKKRASRVGRRDAQAGGVVGCLFNTTTRFSIGKDRILVKAILPNIYILQNIVSAPVADQKWP